MAQAGSGAGIAWLTAGALLLTTLPATGQPFDGAPIGGRQSITAPSSDAGFVEEAVIRPSRPQQLQQEDLRSFTLDELMNLEVTTVSKTSENLFRTPAAVYVITSDEIRRSGLRTIPELLRRVPGMEVAQIDASKWAVTARGFNGRFANKLLVMIDGRSVYTPLFSGVFWDVQNTLLEDIDRIEVVRGPGGTLWGANAVNGVINIITKETAQTQGWFAEAGAGTEEHGFTALRFGGSHENFDYRGYGRFFNRDAYVFADGSDGADGWHMLHGGFRLDWNPGADDDLALSGELYEGEAGLTVLDRSTLSPIETMSDTSGGHVQAGWRHRLAGGSTTDLNVYYDRTRRTQFDNETRDTFDIDFHQVWPAHPRHGIVWGAGYRVTASSGLNPAQFAEGGRTLNLYSGFVQDQIALSAGWSLIVGAKVEHNDFTGFELQPSIRTLWTSDDRYAVWGAVSRAVRTPSEGETDASIQLSGGTDPITGLPIVLVFEGNPDLDTEKLVAYEAGFRAQPRPWFSLDAATFFNTYSDLSEATAGEPMVQLVPPPPRILLPIAGANVGSAETYGVELSSRWQAHPRVRVGLSYSYLEIELTDFAQFDQFDDAGASPHHQLKLSSNADLAYDVELDAYLYFVGRLDALDVDRYTRFDLRLGWRPTPAWEVAVVGQNLFQAEHLEFASSLAGEVPTQVQRSVYGMVQWRH